MKRSKLTPTHLMVGGTIGLPLAALAFLSLGAVGGSIATLFLVWEAWTLVNKIPKDTITEIVQEYSSHLHLIPWLFGFGTAWAIATDNIPNPYAIAGLLMLQGHFFFRITK